LAAVDAALAGYKPNLFTYGSPRVGNDAFQNYLNSKLTGANLRGVYLNDPVPTVPGHFLGFAHVGTEIHFYGCQNNYLGYPKFTEDTPNTDLFATADHDGYWCLVNLSNNEIDNIDLPLE